MVVACSESNILNATLVPTGSNVKLSWPAEILALAPWATGNASGKALAARKARDRAKAERAERAGRGRRRLSQILDPVGLFENKVYRYSYTSKPNDGLFMFIFSFSHLCSSDPDG